MMKMYAASSKRFLAFLIDWYLSSLFGSIPVIIMQSIQSHDLTILNSLEGLSLPYAWAGGVLALICHFLYYCYLPSRAGKRRLAGQTFGMQLLHLQLLTEQEQTASLAALTIRHILFVIVLQSYLTSSGIYLVTLVQMSTGLSIVPYVQTFSYAVILISLGLYFFSKKKQLLQDHLTKTRMYALD